MTHRKGGNRVKKTVTAIIFFVVFAGVGIGLTIYAYGLHGKAKASKNWPPADGTISSSSVSQHKSSSKDSTTYHAEVYYKYSVNGTNYSNNQVTFGDYGSGSPGHAQKIVNRYPAGKTVTVYYNPATPEESVLEPGVVWFVRVMLGAGIVFALVGVPGLLVVGLRLLLVAFVLGAEGVKRTRGSGGS